MFEERRKLNSQKKVREANELLKTRLKVKPYFFTEFNL